jgi:hypothetical protein
MAKRVAPKERIDTPLISCLGCACSEGCLLETNKPKVCCFPRPICWVVFTIIDIMITPFLLMFHFTKIYIAPCFAIIVGRVCCKVCCALNVCHCRYKDCNFPANDNSLGDVSFVNKHPRLCNQGCFCFKFSCECIDPWKSTVKWKRARDLGKDIETGNAKNFKEKHEKMRLFQGKIEPDDIAQGGLGDCWLLAAIATVAEHNDELIKSLFITREADDFSCYQIRLYDQDKRRWRTLTLDDRIPVRDSGDPYFTQPHGNELWVLLLEKAYAKMKGSYGALDGGYPANALTAFTGNDAVTFHANDAKGTMWQAPGMDVMDQARMFKVVSKCLKHNMLMCAGSRHDGKTDKDAPDQGIVHGHAYTILDTATAGGERIIKLRNPWGSGEWTGKYSNKGTKDWMGNIMDSIRSAGQAMAHEDGTFWMPFEDFARYFCHVDICVVKKSIGTMHLQTNEGFGICGLVCGVFKGFVTFFICCQGVKALWFPKRKTTAQLIKSYAV